MPVTEMAAPGRFPPESGSKKKGTAGRNSLSEENLSGRPLSRPGAYFVYHLKGLFERMPMPSSLLLMSRIPASL